MAIAAMAIGVVIILQGLAGLVAPEAFANLIRAIQVPPVIYFAALIRVVFGVVLILAAPVSRAPRGLRIVGVLIAAGGLVTPFFGVEIARVILGWWSDGGAAVVRGWASAALALGAYIVYATMNKRPPAAAHLKR